MKLSSAWLRAAGLGMVTGSRNLLGPALVARRSRYTWLRRAAYLMAAMELIGDKMPWAPSRAAPVWLATRIVGGAGVARSMLREQGRLAAGGALAVGAAAAIVGAFTGLRLRLALTRRLGGGPLANALAGTIEDVTLITIGRRLAGPVPAR
jgi:uncharacterized membrane protein